MPLTSGQRSGTFTIPRTGEWAASVFYRVHLSVTDSAGLMYSTFTDITPRVVEITVQTDPPGLLASLDSWERIAPYTQTGVVGMQRELFTRPVQTVGATTYEFTGWSDGGGVTHLAITPSSNITYTARFRSRTVCSVVVSPPAMQVPATGSTGSVAVATSGNCAWIASEASAWAEVFPISGTGPSPLLWTVYPNFSTRVRKTNVQIGTGTLALTQDAGTGTPDERFVGQLYSSFFGRLASPVEIAFHISVTRADLTMNFLNSDEFANAGLFVAGLYMGLLRRDSEYSGWLFQRNALTSGFVQHEEMVANFIASPEFQLTYGNLSDAGFVDVLYRNILRRPPSTAELDFQTGVLRGGTSRAQLAGRFLNSAEFRLNGGPRLLAFLIYATLLQRDASTAELALREEQIRLGGSAGPIVGDILKSAEFAVLLQ
jgi:hypothetical protein